MPVLAVEWGTHCHSEMLAAVQHVQKLGQASLPEEATYLEVPLLRRILHWLHATDVRPASRCKVSQTHTHTTVDQGTLQAPLLSLGCVSWCHGSAQ